MSKQPEALRLADALHSNDTQGLMSQAATELRRLHEANADMAEALERISLYRAINGDTWPGDVARAALSKHKEQQG
jgi:hypothetical protein